MVAFLARCNKNEGKGVLGGLRDRLLLVSAYWCCRFNCWHHWHYSRHTLSNDCEKKLDLVPLVTSTMTVRLCYLTLYCVGTVALNVYRSMDPSFLTKLLSLQSKGISFWSKIVFVSKQVLRPPFTIMTRRRF